MSIRTQELSKVPYIDHIPKGSHFILETNDEIKRLTANDIIKTVSQAILGENTKLQTVSGVVEQVEKCIANDTIHHVSIPLSGWRDSNGAELTFSSQAPFTQVINAPWVTENSFPELYSDMDDNISTTQYKNYSKTFSILTTGLATTANGSITFKIFKRPTTDINIILKGG